MSLKSNKMSTLSCPHSCRLPAVQVPGGGFPLRIADSNLIFRLVMFLKYFIIVIVVYRLSACAYLCCKSNYALLNTKGQKLNLIFCALLSDCFVVYVIDIQIYDVVFVCCVLLFLHSYCSFTALLQHFYGTFPDKNGQKRTKRYTWLLCYLLLYCAS